MTPTQILHAIYLSIIAGIIVLGTVAMIWWHHDAVLEGKAECQKQVAQAAAAQHIRDAKASQDAINEINQDKQRLQSQIDAQPPPPAVRVCGRVLYVARPVPASPDPARAKPGEPAVGGNDNRVPEGSGGGDVGAGVRALADAGKTLALYRAQLLGWAEKTR